ncbi:hypothetical protein [Salinigranum halophilum]|uniref:hypothetical protein n=1 Tax=Salinigranum halophilum TaxID=2565931 RepID=UPI0010A85574|nr:hypothetical protein [Salinigranum halophilum]
MSTRQQTLRRSLWRCWPSGAVAVGRFVDVISLAAFPSVLLACYVVGQPRVANWRVFGYVRESAPASVLEAAVPIWVEPQLAWWHMITRLTHVFVHAPSPAHAHVLVNVGLLTLVTALLFILLRTAYDGCHRRLFGWLYGIVILGAPLVGSFAFDLTGTAVRGYGASGVAFAFLGVLGMGCLLVAKERWRRLDSPSPSPIYWGLTMHVLLAVGTVVLVVVDVQTSPPGTSAVHPASFAFGCLVGGLLLGRSKDL